MKRWDLEGHLLADRKWYTGMVTSAVFSTRRETGTICFSENFESLNQGFQNGFWELGGVTRQHRTDNLKAVVYWKILRNSLKLCFHLKKQMIVSTQEVKQC